MDPADDGYQMGCGGGEEAGPTHVSTLRQEILAGNTSAGNDTEQENGTQEYSRQRKIAMCSHCKVGRDVERGI